MNPVLFGFWHVRGFEPMYEYPVAQNSRCRALRRGQRLRQEREPELRGAPSIKVLQWKR